MTGKDDAYRQDFAAYILPVLHALLANTAFSFPRPWLQKHILHDRENSEFGQPSQQLEAIKHPSSDYISVHRIANPENSRKVKAQPLIGTSDNGVHLIPSDIYKLGLNDTITGQTVVTRHGSCRVQAPAPHSLILYEPVLS
ncbi:hypothetical protein ARMSODRAFT_1022692 [Armillaria solidipes]|uniref:Uncharacterized protein n=1 Tax=Armillaria solidipes TaxID=1076256 RepID=A0A2H3BG19_9AGAR|nr:hypothetical protein ARMSODRAFT_1022692 [Armillaria solidipes]